MNIVYATSDLYSKPALISIKTLLMNNVNVDEIHIYYVEHGVSDKNKGLIRALVEEYHRQIDFIPMPESFSQVEGIMRADHVVYSYCFFQDILPKNVNKVLLLEADSIVVGDLTELYSMDITDYYFAAADDMENKNIHKGLGLKPDSPYVNCGILLFNLEKMREEKYSEKIAKIIKTGKSKLFFEVQDEMNVAAEGKIKIMPLRFNAYTMVFLFDYKNMLRFRRPTTYYTKEEFDDARKAPVVVHFVKTKLMQPRPWIENCSHPYTKYYLGAKAQTVLADMELWPDKRGVMSRALGWLYSKGMKRIIATLLGFYRSFLTYFSFLYKHM